MAKGSVLPSLPLSAFISTSAVPFYILVKTPGLSLLACVLTACYFPEGVSVLSVVTTMGRSGTDLIAPELYLQNTALFRREA